MMTVRSTTLLLAVCTAAPVAAQDRSAALRPFAREWEQVVAAEADDGRSPAALATLRQALQSPSPQMRAMAARTIGRLERAALATELIPLLSDSSDAVRAAAALAIPFALRDTVSDDAAAALLRTLAGARATPEVVAAAAEALGRLRSRDVAQARAHVAALLPHLVAPMGARLGVVRGLYFKARQPGLRAAFDAAATEALRAEAAPPQRGVEEAGVRVRVVAVATLASIGGADRATLAAALSDPAPYVRREAVAAASVLTDSATARMLLDGARADSAGAVRYEALRARVRRFAATGGCDDVVTMTGDRDRHVALLAIDLLGTPCRGRGGDVLAGLASGVSAGDRWHESAHALVSLAAAAPERARPLLARHAAHDDFFVRTYAARAAALVRDTLVLRTLAEDVHPNVRTAAVHGLAAVAGRAADDIYLAQLAQDDSELVMAAAAALEGTQRTGVADRLLDALDRITAQQRETSRDARMALLARASALGSAAQVGRVRPYVRDFDPVIAAAAVATLREWSGEVAVAVPQPLAPQPLPTFAQAAAVDAAVARITFEDGRTIDVKLFPFAAPANALRFARLADGGYYDGLTIHRVAPNFVIQGGSPDANEYSGDGPFTRDELGIPNWRGTMGLSTRGRHTGDAQFYINLIDNVRLDTDYTVFGVIVSGLEVADRVQEGARISRIRITR